MGVQGLQNFIKYECPHVRCRIHIGHMVQDYKLNTGRNPVIVVDGNCCLRFLYKNLNFVHGGQFKEFSQLLNEFVCFFNKLGVKLVVFFDGPTQERKREKWCNRRYETWKDIEDIYLMLRDGVQDIPQSLSELPTCAGMVAREFFRSEPSVEVFTSFKECDEEIVEHVIKNDCFAILGQDTDYLIYDAKYNYFTLNDLNLRNGTTFMINRAALANHLGIQPSVLPLMATLIGNDIVRREELTDFHRRLLGGPSINRELFYAVAEYCKQFSGGWLSSDALEYISLAVFGTKKLGKRIQESWSSYVPRFVAEVDEEPPVVSNSQKILHMAKLLMMNSTMTPCIFSIIYKGIFEMSSSLEDPQCRRFPPIARMYQALRTRIYGILLKENKRFHAVKEYCYNKNEGGVVAREVLPVMVPEDLFPGLLALWDKENKSLDMETKRWQLFIWVLTGSRQLSVERLQSVDRKFLALVAVCRYLRQMKYVFDYEIAALVIQAIQFQKLSTQKLRKLQVPAFSLYAVNLAPIFLRGVQHVQFAVHATGLQIDNSLLTPLGFFDGTLFQSIYMKMSQRTPFSSILRDWGTQILFKALIDAIFEN